MIRLLKADIFHFKNVDYGTLSFMNYNSLRLHRKREAGDVVGLYGSNGSGKSAAVEVLDITKAIFSSEKINYDLYADLISPDGNTQFDFLYYYSAGETPYLVRYSVRLVANEKTHTIGLKTEQLSLQAKGADWLKPGVISINNPYANADSLLWDVQLETSFDKSVENSTISANADRLALYSSQQGLSFFFNDTFIGEYTKQEDGSFSRTFGEMVRAFRVFGRHYFQVVRVNQFGMVNVSSLLPLLVHISAEEKMTSGVMTLMTDQENTILDEHFTLLQKSIEAINIALKGMIPDLSLEIEKKEEILKDNKIFYRVAIYSVRNGKRFSIRHESDGIKRLVSLLVYLISAYSSEEVCLVIDEFDDGVFEYLLGEIIATMGREARGQLIFTSHNLRIMEKLPTKNIICTTTNPMNRYIRLHGYGPTNNIRDFYIRALRLGGQEEELYNMADIEDIGRALCEANMVINAGTEK